MVIKLLTLFVNGLANMSPQEKEFAAELSMQVFGHLQDALAKKQERQAKG